MPEDESSDKETKFIPGKARTLPRTGGRETQFIWRRSFQPEKENVIIEFQDVELIINDQVIFTKINQKFFEGEKVGIIGGNGSGKSAFLGLCAGVIEPSKGWTIVSGIDPARGKYADIIRIRRKIGYVFQEGVLINNITVFDNVSLPLVYHSILTQKDIESKVVSALEKFNLLKYEDAMPADLSQGIKKLVEYARAFIIEPIIYLIDEPFADLDSEGIKIISEFLSILKFLKDVTILLAGSDEKIFRPFVDKFIFLENKFLTFPDKK